MFFKSKLAFILYILGVLCVLCGRIHSCSKIEKEEIKVEEIEIIELPDPLREKAQEIAASIDDRLLVAQLFITGIDGRGSLPQHMKTLLEETPAGGVMLFRQNVNTNNESIRSLITETVSLITEQSGVAPFIAVDFEGGTVNRFAGNKELPAASTLPSAASYWEMFLLEDKMEELISVWQNPSVWHEIKTLKKIQDEALYAGRELAALGINMNFAPVAEHLNDNNRVFLQNRSYGPDLNFVREACLSFYWGMKEASILCVPKHFPGSAGNDPHYAASVLNLEIEDTDWTYDNNLHTYVFVFKNLFWRNARAVMVAHTLIPAIDDKIASLSSKIMLDFLREQLEFDGLIIADDFSMAAAGNLRPEQAAVLSVAAGADMILVWQSNLMRTYTEFMKALEDGRLSRERLREAASRIIYEKLKMNLSTDYTD